MMRAITSLLWTFADAAADWRFHSDCEYRFLFQSVKLLSVVHFFGHSRHSIIYGLWMGPDEKQWNGLLAFLQQIFYTWENSWRQIYHVTVEQWLALSVVQSNDGGSEYEMKSKLIFITKCLNFSLHYVLKAESRVMLIKENGDPVGTRNRKMN